MRTGSLNLEIRLAEPVDLAPISAFLPALGGPSFAERFPGKTPPDFYRWKYFQNPVGEAIVGIATAGSSVVSVVAATPKRIWLSGKVVLAYELGDFLTDGKYRQRGLFSELIELVCREAGTRGAPLVYVRPNEVSFPILTAKLSFFEAQRMDARRFVLPSQALSRKTAIPASVLRLSGLDSGLRSFCIPRFPSGALTVKPVIRFGEEIDRLWSRASHDYAFALVRDSSYLNWRFSDCPTPYKMWCAVRNGEAAGFLVASADQTVPEAAILELFTLSRDEEAVQALLAAGMDSLLRSGIRSVNTWTLQASSGSAAHSLLRRALPFRRKQHLHLAFRILNPDEIKLPLPSQNWHFTLGDSDGA